MFNTFFQGGGAKTILGPPDTGLLSTPFRVN